MTQTESSLQISSSSPDGIPSRALQVQVASAIQSESSASSQTPSHAEPLRRNRSRSRDSPYEGGSQAVQNRHCPVIEVQVH